MIKLIVIVFCLFGLFSGCSKRQSVPVDNVPQTNQFPIKMPVAVSNNAVAHMAVDGSDRFYTFNGLLVGKTYQDITNQAFMWHQGDWKRLTVPAEQLPVLASTAVSVDDHVYLFGGYTVAADHSEKSIPNVWKINAAGDQWTAMPPMPTPVDDTVALVYQDRYIYLISGWHDVDNVDLVQVFDVVDQVWHQATTFPLPPVFGHAGGIIGEQMLICDGVKVNKHEDKKQFLPSPACVIGQIDVDDFTRINWQMIDHHSGTAYYRMAAVGGDESQIYFIGGSDNPYNYDGLGYNKIPSSPTDQIRTYDLNNQKWSLVPTGQSASMDHRALLITADGLHILGGMAENQQVTDDVITIEKK